MIKNILFLLIVFTAFSAAVSAQRKRPISGDSQQIATTEDGRKVILNSDGTWRYAENQMPDPEIQIVKVGGFSFKLNECQKIINKSDQKIVECSIDVTNLNNSDTTLTLFRGDTVYYDNFGKRVEVDYIQLPGSSSASLLIMKDTTIKMLVGFQEGNPDAKLLTNITISKINNGVVNQSIKFKNVKIKN